MPWRPYWLDCDQEDVHIWPLGNLVGPSHSSRSSEHILIALAGPLTSGILCLAVAIGVHLIFHAQFVWNPFGNLEDCRPPRLASGDLAKPLSALWIVGWFGYVNYLAALG